jgi:bifunctional oligoribonuclease and PAP phosphatase NrnA
MTKTDKTRAAGTANRAPEDLLKRLRDGHRFLLSSHKNPDGDSIGSSLGLARVLRSLGKGVVIWFRDEPPEVYGAIPGADRIHSGTEPPAGWPEKFDAVVTLECPSLDRTGLEEQLPELPIVNIDHHLGNQLYGQVNWVDSAAPSLGEMIFRLAEGLKVPLDETTATILYMTIVSDTGGFRFANATAEAFESSASLVRNGASPEQVSKWLYESTPEPALRLLGEMIGSLALHDEGRIATVELTRDMFERTGARPGDTEGLVGYPRSVAGVEVVALMRHLEDGGLKLSFRSRGDVDVESIARRHDGGGHKNAAGALISAEELEDKGLDTVRSGLVEELREALARPAAGQDDATGETGADETPEATEAG